MKGYTTMGVILCELPFLYEKEKGMQINGIHVELSDRPNIKEYLEREGFQLNRIAVEYNGDILPQSEYEQTFLQQHDVLEVVSFVGGG